MYLFQAFVFALAAFSCLFVTTAQDYDALTNIQLGMEGLMKAGSDPAMLAQLMQDMQVRIAVACSFVRLPVFFARDLFAHICTLIINFGW
jgi:hypothetical protein